jgi:exopolysaccharide production protein ExoQ
MPVRPFERIFVIVFFMSSMGVVDALTRPYLDARDPDIVSTQIPLSTAIIESVLYFWGALFIFTRWRRVLKAARVNWPLIALALLSLLSILWSIQPSLTLRRSTSLFVSTLLGIYLGERFSTTQLARLMTQAMGAMIACVLIFYLVAPSYIIDYSSYSGAWRGLSIKKNSFGLYMSLAVLLFLLVRLRHFAWSRYLLVAVSVILLLLSRSATSLVLCAMVVALIPLWRLTCFGGKQRLLVYTFIPAVVLLVIYVLSSHSDELFRIVGRDPTFTGRTNLWELVMAAISKQPLLGYGFGAFWSGMRGEALNIYLASKWTPVEAHNGYLELCLSIGVLGLPVLVYLIMRSLRMAASYVRTHEGLVALWPISYLTLFLIHNFFESHLLETRSLEFLIFVALTTSLSLERRIIGEEVTPTSGRLFPAHRNDQMYSPILR